MKANVVVDEEGRLALPKEIREAMGIFGRTSVEIEVVDNAARISAAPKPTPRGTIRQRGGRVVFTGPLPADWDSGAAVLNARDRWLRR